MELQKFIILVWCICFSFASEHLQTIPVEGYETELQDLGEHIDHHDTPIKVIKIIKTIAVKVPVPYPVKVIEKVPYPVHISKPYPVPVPHIVKVPHPVHAQHAHEAVGEGVQNDFGSHSYQVQEAPNSADQGHSLGPSQDSYSGVSNGHNVESYAGEYPSEGSSGGAYEAPSQGYFGSDGVPDGESFETRSYDQAIQAYLNKHHPNANINSYH